MQRFTTPQAACAWLQSQGVRHLQTDSRTLRAGDGFIAWPGFGRDTQRFVPSALAAGALACLVEADGRADFGADASRVASYAGLKAGAGAIADALLGHPSRSLKLCAVTGTNGKTSTAWWLAQALSNLPEAMPCGLIGTLGVGPAPALGLDQANALQATGFTTPDPVSLQQTLRRFVDQGLQACAIEASSIGIEEQRMNGAHLHTAIFTNLTQDHLDYHGNMLAYGQAKRRLFSWPGLQCAVLNIDDPFGAALAQEMAATPIDLWTVSLTQAARLRAESIAYNAAGLAFEVVEGGQRVPMQTQLIGNFNVSNLLGVMAAMRGLGVALDTVVQVCSRLHPVPGRMQCITQAGHPLVAVDYAHTPDALEQALAALRPMAQARGGKLWCVFGCGGDRDSSKRPLMGAIAARAADHTLVTSDNPRSEAADAIIAQIVAGCPAGGAVQVQADRARAIADCISQAQATDVVLIAGKGHESTQEIAGVKAPFSDLTHAGAALAQRTPTAELTA